MWDWDKAICLLNRLSCFHRDSCLQQIPFLVSFLFFLSSFSSDKLNLTVIQLINPFRCCYCLPGRASETALPLSTAAPDKNLFTSCHRLTHSSESETARVKPVMQACRFRCGVTHQEIWTAAWTASLFLHVHFNYYEEYFSFVLYYS